MQVHYSQTIMAASSFFWQCDKNLQKPLLLSQTQPSSLCVFYSVSKSVVHCIELPVNETASCFLTEQGEISIIRSGVITVNSLLVAIISVLFCPCFYGDVLISDSLAQQVTLCPIMQLFSCFTEDHYQDMTTAKVLIRCHWGWWVSIQLCQGWVSWAVMSHVTVFSGGGMLHIRYRSQRECRMSEYIYCIARSISCMAQSLRHNHINYRHLASYLFPESTCSCTLMWKKKYLF